MWIVGSNYILKELTSVRSITDFLVESNASVAVVLTHMVIFPWNHHMMLRFTGGRKSRESGCGVGAVQHFLRVNAL
jgi:hypothetical protein